MVTAPAASQALLDETDVTLRDDSDNDITTEEPFLKKCIVDGKFYSHGQTVMTDDNMTDILANFDKENLFLVW